MANYKHYNNYSEQDKQSLVIEKLGRLKTAIEEMPSGGGGEGIQYIQLDISDDGVLTRKAETTTTGLAFSLPANVTSIGENALERIYSYDAYDNPVKISKVSITGQVALSKNALYYAFYNQPELTEANMNGLVGEINTSGLDHAFYGCKKMTSISFKNITKLVSPSNKLYTLGNCTALKSVDFSNLEEVGTRGLSYFFYGSGIETITFPKLRKVTSSAFVSAMEGCSLLTDMYFPALVPSDVDSYAFYDLTYKCTNVKVHLPASFEGKSLTGPGGTNCVYVYDL